MAVPRASSIDDTTKKLALRSIWKVGDKFPINLAPSVEGMVAATKWREGVFSVVFLAPPFLTQGGTWAEATITYRTTSSFKRKPLPKYDYPFPTDKRILQEAMKANGNIEMLQEIIGYMNKVFPFEKSLPAEKEIEQSCSPWEEDEEEHRVIEGSKEDCGSRANIKVGDTPTSITRQDVSSDFFSDELLDKLATALSERMSHVKESSAKSDNSSTQSSSVSLKKRKNGLKRKSKKKKYLGASSSSSSSTGSSRSSSSSSDVGFSTKKGGSGWFHCPFSPLDSRHVTSPKSTIRGRHEERKMLRKALHNLYSEFTTLKWYVDWLKTEQSNASFKPYASDLTWLSQHAVYLDQILLHGTKGPWNLWNELALEYIVRAFLELLVRASPTRAYPEILDEKVRKWMKRKRVGLSAQFGPIPAFLTDAKISDAGIQPKGGWNAFPRKENKSASFQNAKPKGVGSSGSDKKPQV